jgi:hypothetical protein
MLLQHATAAARSCRRAASNLRRSLQYAQLVECESHAIVLHKVLLLLNDIHSR